MKPLTFRINSYIAVLLITIAGAGAATLIIHIANSGDDFLASSSYGQAKAFLKYNTLR